ncbi:MAG: BON domain-containing protein [Ramlibacter sp.]
MRSFVGKLAALGAGALAMYYLDPQLGAQRRGALGELLRSGLRPPADPAVGRLSRRTFHRQAMADPQADAELRSAISQRLGRLVSYPQAIHVSVEHGVARLSGDVLAKERDGLLLQVREMPGVQKLVNAMTAHETPATIGGQGLPAARQTA